MSHTQCMNAIFIFEVVRLIWRPEGEVFQLLTSVHKGSFNTSVIQPDPGLLSVVAMLDVHILFLVVNCGQVCARIFALIFSGQPTSACGTCEVAIAIKETPARLTNVLKKQRKSIKIVFKQFVPFQRTTLNFSLQFRYLYLISGNKPGTKIIRTFFT